MDDEATPITDEISMMDAGCRVVTSAIVGGRNKASSVTEPIGTTSETHSLANALPMPEPLCRPLTVAFQATKTCLELETRRDEFRHTSAAPE